jgi:hypothetical protein
VSAVCFAADQLLTADFSELMALYGVSVGRWRHGGRIRKRYDYRVFTDFGGLVANSGLDEAFRGVSLLPRRQAGWSSSLSPMIATTSASALAPIPKAPPVRIRVGLSHSRRDPGPLAGVPKTGELAMLEKPCKCTVSRA